MTTYAEICRSCFDEIEARLQDRSERAGLLQDIAAYHLSTGGKRVRAFLPVWACVNLGGCAADAFDLGAGIELLHNATLIHDDLQDGDRLRRGRPAVWCKWGAAQAINAGDAMIFQGLARFLRAPAGAGLMTSALSTLARVAQGQAMEFQMQLPPGDASALPGTLNVWMQMARGKTGALFGLCLRAGAVAAHAGAAVIGQAEQFGENVGTLFQVHDDYLDLIGGKEREHPGCDLLEGKRSFPIVWAYQHASADQLLPIDTLFNTAREKRTLAMVGVGLEALSACGALDATRAWLQRERDAIAQHAFAKILPGLIDLCLAPSHQYSRAEFASRAGRIPTGSSSCL